MKRRTRLIVLALPFAVTGCVNPIPPNAHDYTTPRADTAPRPIPGSVNGSKWHIVWRTRDEKTGAKTLPVLIADAQTGSVTDETETPTLELNAVQSKVYQDGRHAADIQAKHIEANQREKIVNGSGGVIVTAHGRNAADKSVTVITADKMKWDTNTNKVIAFGNASIVRRSRPGQPALSQNGGRIVYDMKQDTFEVLAQTDAPADAPQ